MKILLTGATGFVGRAVTKSACLAGHEVTALVRNFSDALPKQVSQIAVGDFVILADVLTNTVIASKAKQPSSALKNTQWTATASGLAVTTDRTELASDNRMDSRLHGNDNKRNGNDNKRSGDDDHLTNTDKPSVIPENTQHLSGIQTGEKLVSAMQDIDVIIHTAARAHVMKEKHSDPAEIYRQINVAFTQQLAEAAAEAGVKRFVFLSSIKVNGEATFKQPFTEADLADPEDDYAKSKWRAEQVLMEIGQRSGMEIVILRPPMIYGPGVKGNFANLLKLVNKGIPVPFGSVKNQRSLLALDNLVTAILLAAKHPAAANQTFLVADDEAVSTTQLIKYIANAQGKKARLLPVPVSLMTFVAKILGKQSVADRLFGSLQIDTAKIQKQLGWRPVVTMQQQLEKMFTELDDGFPPARE